MGLGSFLKSLLPHQRTPLGVAVSRDSLRYARVTDEGVSDYGALQLPNDTIVDGTVRDPESFSALLKTLRNVNRNVGMYVSLPTESMFFFELSVPVDTLQAQIQKFIESSIEKYTPIAKDAAHYTYRASTAPNGATNRIAVTVCKRSVIVQYTTLFKNAGLRVKSFELGIGAATRALFPPEHNGISLAIDCGSETTSVGVVQSGMLRSAKTFTGSFGENGAVHTSLSELISAYIDEWHKKEPDPDRFIDVVVLFGSVAQAHGLPEHLSDVLGIETVRANVWQNIYDMRETIPPIAYEHSFGYATAIGLALSERS